MHRRDFIAALAAALAPVEAARAAAAVQATPSAAPAAGDYAAVVAKARALSKSPFAPAKTKLSGPFANLNYNQYRGIRPHPVPLGRGRGGFSIDLLPPGFIYHDPVTVTVLSQDGARDLPFKMDLFDFDPKFFPGGTDLSKKPAPEGASFSGFRLRTRINRVDVSDEFVVFQGASYFRAIARGMIFGLSGRGLAIRTGDPRGEEFPTFRHFWIETPAPGALSIVVRALLDSASCTGAFEFDITPGETTVMRTRCTLFPREKIDAIGIAPLTSMFLFGPQWRSRTDDYRNAVHDSEGLQMITGRDERLWRPLTNPRKPQVSAFQDMGPKGFGLTQRRRDFAHYQDDEARYDKRPSGWVEPVDDWGRGAVVLVEIPADHEFNDNIVAFWRPKDPLGPTDDGHAYGYTLYWCAEPPDAVPLARVVATRTGKSIDNDKRRVMVVDFHKEGRWADPLKVEARISSGEVTGVALRALPGGDKMRASFEFTPGNQSLLELQLTLVGPDGPESEKWLYRWTPA